MKSLSGLAFAALILLCSIAKANETEPNNTPSNADTLALNNTDSGAINTGGDTDWFKVTTSDDGKLSVKLNNIGGGVLTFSLYDTAGIILLKGPLSVQSSQKITMETDGLGAGTFFILIKGNTLSDTSSYYISDSLFSPAQQADKEPDDSFFYARKLVTNGSHTGHIGYYYNNTRDSSDWYKITTTKDALIKLTFASVNDDTIKVTFYDLNGKTILGSAVKTMGVSPTITTDGLATGIYYVRLTADKGFTPYVIMDSVLSYDTYPRDREPNKHPYQADTLPANSTATGHVSFYNNSKVDSSDYFKLFYTGNTGNLKLTVNILPALSDSLIRAIRFDVFKDTLTAPVSANTFSQKSNILNLTSLTPGTYFIRVQGQSQSFGGASAYSITDSFSVILPVTFISFNGRINNGEANLNWSTATEINNKGFEVQKSMDGHTFAPVGFVKGAGNSSRISNYSFADPKLLSGSDYYRLQQVDFDGKFIYSSTIKLNYSKFDWAILGNPVNNLSWIQLQLDKTSDVSIQIISSAGNIIQTINRGKIQEGTYSIPLNVSHAGSQMYVVRLVVNNKAYSKKIIK